MKHAVFLLLLFAVIALCCPAFSESTNSVYIEPGEEWCWDPGSDNTFEGEMNLSGYTGQAVSIIMYSDLTGEINNNEAVFTSLNGKRITIMKQSNTLQCNPDDSPVIQFSGRLKLPEKEHVKKVSLSFRIMSEDGRNLNTVSALISNDTENKVSQSAFYIPFQANTITVSLGAAAIIVWCIAVFLNYKNKKYTKQGE